MNAGALEQPFAAVVLAGERPGGSALSRQLGLSSSVLVEVAGQPAVQRVIQALSSSQQVGGGVLCGPSAAVWQAEPRFADILQDTAFTWLEPASGPSASAIAAARFVDHYPLLLTAGDHALLTAEIVDGFCRAALQCEQDIIVGLAPHDRVKQAFPHSRRTVQKYRDGAYCGTNLFAVMNARGLNALRFWQSVEALRKQPWKIAHKFGPLFLSRYLLHQVTLQQALQQLSRLCDCSVGHVLVDSARAAVDVDSLADRELAEQVLRESRAG